MTHTVGNSLRHFGVKGMKWGVRRSDVPASEDHTQTKAVLSKAKAGGTKALSNNELQTAIARLNLEQQFSRLNPSTLKKGQQIVTEILGLGNTVNTAVNFSNTLVKKIKTTK